MDEIRGGLAQNEQEILNASRFFDSVKELSLSKSSDDLLDRLLKKAAELVNPEIAAFLQKDLATGDLCYVKILGEKTESLKDKVVRQGEGLCGLAAETNQNLLITDCAKDPRFNSEVDQIPGLEIRSLMVIPFRIEKVVYGVVYLVNKKDKPAFNLEEFKFLLALTSFAELNLERLVLLKQIRELEDFDQLTQTYKAKTLFEYFQREVARSERYGTDLSLIKVVVDYYEKIIQTFGQEAGERVLLNLSFILKKTTRKVDLVSRVGQNEFLVLLPNTNRAGALKIQDRLQKILENQNLRATGIPYTVTVNVYSESGVRAVNLYKIPEINAWLNQNSKKSRRRKYPTTGELLEEAITGSLFSGQK